LLSNFDGEKKEGGSVPAELQKLIGGKGTWNGHQQQLRRLKGEKKNNPGSKGKPR